MPPGPRGPASLRRHLRTLAHARDRFHDVPPEEALRTGLEATVRDRHPSGESRRERPRRVREPGPSKALVQLRSGPSAHPLLGTPVQSHQCEDRGS